MKGKAELTIPETALVLGTRAALGIGLGMLLANRFSLEQRRAIGGTLLLAGAFSAAVLASELFGKPRAFTVSFGSDRDGEQPAPGSESRTIRHPVPSGN
jgi:hypothetical protein